MNFLPTSTTGWQRFLFSLHHKTSHEQLSSLNQSKALGDMIKSEKIVPRSLFFRITWQGLSTATEWSECMMNLKFPECLNDDLMIGTSLLKAAYEG